MHNFGVMARVLHKWGSSFCLLCDFKELGVAKRPHLTTPTRIVSQRPLSRIVRADPKEPRPCPAETVSSRSSRWPASVGSHGFRHSNLWRCGCSLLDLRCDCAHAPGLLVLSVMQLLLS